MQLPGTWSTHASSLCEGLQSPSDGGVKQAPNVAQRQIMENLFCNCNDVDDVYIDDIGIFSNLWDDHHLLEHDFQFMMLALCGIQTRHTTAKFRKLIQFVKECTKPFLGVYYGS
jgi:hypothetical protein